MGMREERKVYLVECERSGPHLELTDCECGTRNLSTKVFPLRRAKNDAGMAGSTTESVGASTAEISGVFGRVGFHAKLRIKSEKADADTIGFDHAR